MSPRSGDLSDSGRLERFDFGQIVDGERSCMVRLRDEVMIAGSYAIAEIATGPADVAGQLVGFCSGNPAARDFAHDSLQCL